MATSEIKKSTPTLEYVQDVFWWGNSWTCPADGIVVAEMVSNTSSAKAYWYITDSTISKTSGKMNQTADGTSQTISFPVIKGHTYTTQTISAISYAYAHYYKFTN